MEIDIDTYFWMVDRGLFDDDQRNKVDMERGKVILYREHSARFENASYVAQLMLILKKSVMKISKKPFTIDPQLSTLKDNASVYTKNENWNLVIKELKKFGVRVDGDKKEKIIEGRTNLIADILGRLFDFDTGISNNKLIDVNSSVIVQESNGRDNSLNGSRNTQVIKAIDDSVMGGGGLRASQSLILNAPVPKKNTLEPLERNQSLNIRSSGRNPDVSTSVILNKNLTLQTEKQSKQQSEPYNLEAFNEMDTNKDLKDCKSTFEFILLALSKYLEVKPKQAIGLLSDNHKYLIHIVVKGTKGGEFGKLIALYQGVQAHSKILSQLIYSERSQNSLQSTMNILKSGLYSSNIELAIVCCRVLQILGSDLINTYGDEMSTICWNWFINEPQSIQTTQTIDQSAMLKGESGLQACIYGLRRHTFDFIEHIIGILFIFGKSNYIQLFTQNLQSYFTKSEFADLIHDTIFLANKSAQGKQILFMSSILDTWIEQSIKQSDFDFNNSLEERISALSFLARVWELIPEKIEAKPDLAQAILAMLKRGCRDRSKTIRTTSCEFLFRLIQKFSIERNEYAPLIYKTLTFLLIEFHSDLEQREQMFRFFINMFEELDSIPVVILSEPLLKQIQISDGSTYHFNVFDFEFFKALSNHKRLNISSAIMIVEIMAKLAQSNLFFANSAISIIELVMIRYKEDQNLLSSLQQIVQACLKQIAEQERQKHMQEQDRKKQQISNIKMEEEIIKNTISRYTLKKLQEEQLQKQQTQEKEYQQSNSQRKSKEKLLINLLAKLIQTSPKGIMQDIKIKILGTYHKIEKELKVKNKALNYLLGLFNESIPDMMQFYIEHVLPRHDQFIEEIFPYMETKIAQQQQLMKFESVSQPDSQATNKYEIVPYEPKQVNPLQKKYKEKAQQELQKIISMKLEVTQKQSLEEELKKMKEEKQLAQAKKKLEERKIMHGIDSKVQRGKSADYQVVPYDEQFLEKDQHHMKRLIVPATNNQPLKGLDKKLVKKVLELQLFDIRYEEQNHQDAVKYFLKKNTKIIRHLFNSYCFTGPYLHIPKTFDEKQGQLRQITISEILKMLQDYSISKLQMSKEDLITIVRLINKDILKKSQKNQPSLLVLEFEGFMEFMLQLAVHIYSFEAAMTPYEYIEKLFNHFKRVAKENGMSTHKLFEDPDLATFGDPGMKIELNKRLQYNPNSTIPDGFTKVVEKDVLHIYKVPDYFPIQESQKIVIEILDEMLSNEFGFHFLEPMIEIFDVHKVRQKVKHVPKENQDSSVPRYLQPVQPKSRQRVARNKLSTSMDVNPIRPAKDKKIFQAINSSTIIDLPSVKPQLGAILKIEIGKKPGHQKQHCTEVAYVLEEMLQAVEKGRDNLPGSKSHKPKIINRALEGKQKQLEEEEKLRQQQKQRFEQRKQILKEQLEKMKEDQSSKKQELDEQRKQQAILEKKKKEKLEKDKKKAFEQVVKEAELKKQQKEEQEQKKEEPKKEEPIKEKAQASPDKAKAKEVLKKKKEDLQEMFKKQAEERQAQQKKKEEEEKNKEEKMKQQKIKASQIYTNQKQQITEKKEVLKQRYNEFRESEELKFLISRYDKQLQSMFDAYCKFDPDQRNLMTYNAYKQMGIKSLMVPQIISNQEYIYIFKTIMRDKVKGFELLENRVDNLESHKLNLVDFIETLIKISCFAKAKIAALYIQHQVENAIEGEQVFDQQQPLETQKGGSTLRINNLTGEQLLEREMDLGDAPLQTIENLFKFLNFK